MLTDKITNHPAIRKPSRGDLGVKRPAVRWEVAPGERVQEVVVAHIDRGVPEHNEGRNPDL